jgi:quercetin dioxygenase-like cupin family protein
VKQVSLNSIPLQGVSHNFEIRKQVMLSTGDVPHLTQFAQAQLMPGQIAIAHAHRDMHEIFFVQSGHGTMTINGQSYTLIPGVCIAVAPGEIHEVRNTGTETLVLNYFGILE